MPAKIQYLIGHPPHQKLKRSVPADIVEMVGQKNWVETVSGLSQKELKRRSHEFAVRTNREIEGFRERLRSGERLFVSPAFSNLDHIDYELALAKYVTARRASALSVGAYVLPSDKRDQADTLANAVDDVIRSEIEARGDEVHTDAFALRLLRSNGFLTSADYERIRKTPDWLESAQRNESFQQFCSLLRFEDVRWSRAILDALQSGRVDLLGDRSSPSSMPRAGTSSLVTMRGLSESFLSQKRSDLTTSRKSQISLALRLANEFFGEETVIASISRDRCKEFIAFAPRVPGYVAQHYRGRTMMQAAEDHFRKKGEYAKRPREAQKYVQITHSALT